VGNGSPTHDPKGAPTNGLGNGHVKVHEASVSSHAYVFIEDGPAGQFYVTETYFH